LNCLCGRGASASCAAAVAAALLRAKGVQHSCGSPIARQAIAKQSAERGPALDPQQLSYLAVAIAAIVLDQTDHGKPQTVIVSFHRLILHGTARKADGLTGPALRCGELLARVNDSLTKLARRQALGFRQLTLSLRISLSSSSSATILFSRAFSFSRLRSSDS